MKKEQKVKVGQIWQDWDCRFRNVYFPRLIKIKSIDKFALLAKCENIDTHKITRIRIDRFKPTSNGYKLFKDK